MLWHSRCGLALLIASVQLTPVLSAPVTPAAPAAMIVPFQAAGPNILGTVAVPIKAERFRENLNRARADASSSPVLQHLITPARPLPPLQQLSFVQRAVHASIQWVSDTTEWGQHDYWATASQTLARGAGDMEDRAIVKMQALRALGFNNSDLFLTLARDRVGGPITVLIVRVSGKYYVLDDTGGAPFLAEERRFEFQPVITFGWSGAWVHLRPAAPSAVASATTAFARK